MNQKFSSNSKIFSGKSILLLTYIIVISPLIFFTVVMLQKIIPYLSFGHADFFLSTKTEATLNNNFFRTGFYIHITASWLVLVTGLLQFFPQLTSVYPKVHRSMGKIYVLGILLLAAPSGLILASFANGGLPAKTGFTLQCFVWWFATLIAFRKILDRNFKDHVRWMIRSYAVTLAAMSLRTEGYFLHYFFGTKPIETYITITWLSWVGNLIIAETLITIGLDRFLLKKLYAKKQFT